MMSPKQKSFYSTIDEIKIKQYSPDKQGLSILSPCPKYRIDSIESIEPDDELPVSPLNLK